MNSSFSDIDYIDYRERYERVMQFNKNKASAIHRWYPFVEGYSREFIRGIVDELPHRPDVCLDPFAGSGTTPLELQSLGVACTAFEVNPFMYNLAKAKLRTDYTVNGFLHNYSAVADRMERSPENIEEFCPIPEYTTIVDRGVKDKWIYHWDTMRGLLDIKWAIREIRDLKYRNLFQVALASILLEVSNVYRNGKCMSYRENWRNPPRYARRDVHDAFLARLSKVMLPDIKDLARHKQSNSGKPRVRNYKNIFLGDARQSIESVADATIDLIITSPPYLNSRDYTDTYMIELWMLDYISNYDALRELRNRTIRSHVQVKWGEVELVQSIPLAAAVERLKEVKRNFWNRGLLNMIKGYFMDMDSLFERLYPKMKSGGKVYFNVANSAYYGIEIQTDIIVSDIARSKGFTIDEVRMARMIKPSSQQKDLIRSLPEVVLVMSK